MKTKKTGKKSAATRKPLLQRPHKWFRILVRTLWIGIVTLVVGMILYVKLVQWNPLDLFGGMPSLEAIENPENDLSSEVLSADGISLGRYFRYNRSQVSYQELPPLLVKTLITSEDHRFYDHAGMDLWSYARVVWGVLTLNSQGGGSTLTQQTAKNLFSTRSEELQGKLARLGLPMELLISKTKEWIIAVKLEETFTKEEIIALYLNTVPFNNNSYGVKIAAETYFNKSLDALTQDEAALLVGMLQGTNRFNPVNHPDRALSKRNDVLFKLYKHHQISLATYDSLATKPLGLDFHVASQNQGLATYFRTRLQQELIPWCEANGYDLFESGLKIYTTIDSRLQRLAEDAVAQRMAPLQDAFESKWGSRNPWVDDHGVEQKDFLDRKLKSAPAYRALVKRYGRKSDSVEIMLNIKKHMQVFTWEGERDTLFSQMDSLRYYNRFLHTGLMSMDPNSGAIKVWVGGIDQQFFQYDHVRQGKRQPGSTFKPFVYGKAMEEGYSPCLKLKDESPLLTVNGHIYHVKNSNGTYGSGETYTLRQAMARSLNSITMQMMDRLKPENVVDFAHRLGIKSELTPVYSLSLGTSDVSLYEMVGAYCAIVNLGMYTEPYYITRIEDKHGNVVANFVPKIRQVLDEQTAYKIIYLLQGGVQEAGGTSQSLSQAVRSDNEIGGKTGTTDNASDGWYMGITHDLVTGIWVGGDEPGIHFPSWAFGSGGRTALPIFDTYMAHVYQHPETGIRKGIFKRPAEFNFTLECPEDEDDGDGTIWQVD